MLSQRLFKLVCIMVVGTGLIEEVEVIDCDADESVGKDELVADEFEELLDSL